MGFCFFPFITFSFTNLMRVPTSGALPVLNWLPEARLQPDTLLTGSIARQRDISMHRSGMRMRTATARLDKDLSLHFRMFTEILYGFVFPLRKIGHIHA